ncbi:hypothetical protein [Desulfuromonas sp.]|uniref:hypothetical protein n=1 Tax=Desulfuromonas sp. TaxID=892 RepID=UPI0025C443FC|nr:hypothetical protein [Desulfuromonas sp.]
MERLKAILESVRILPDLPALLGAGERCFLVGGALRDWQLDRVSTDFDFATPGDPTPLAKLFARRLGGTWFSLDAARCQSRIVAEVEGRRLTYDFAPFRGTDLDDDLRKRDFTINALALDLASSLQLHDPLGARQDLREGMLRCCSAEVFMDDPLRILKGARHRASLAFEIEGATFERMKGAAPGLGGIAGERVRGEVAALFACPPAKRNLSPLGLLHLETSLFGPCGPGGSFEDGVARVTRCEELIDALLGKGDRGWLESRLAAEAEEGVSVLTLLKIALFLKGYRPREAAFLSDALRLSRRSRAALVSLAGLSDDRWGEIAALASRERSRALWVDSLGRESIAAAAFLAALANGAPGELAGTLFPLLESFRTHEVGGRVPDLLNGAWLRERLKIGEGPHIGILLEKVRREEMLGRIRSRGDAEKFLISLVQKRIDKASGRSYNRPGNERE